ncbi:MAG: histone deacetylase family protein [Proteobacteria bacterium]|nr:histone deacetylase family protein [Pseudomonadota bacterium]
MTTALITHPACLRHEPPAGHPETPARLQAVLDALSGDAFHGLKRERAPRVQLAALARVHSRAYIKALFAQIPKEGFVMVERDTGVSPGSREAALRAAGAVVRGVDLVMAGKVKNAFCAVRPPGHHAEPGRAMGFCLFNNIAVGAAHARSRHGLRRIAIVDFDAHHGNGTQAAFGTDSEFFYGSTHQSPLYPGTGRQSESANILNLPLEPGAGSAAFRRAFAQVLLPRLRRFKPEFVFVSAGFDAHRDDPLAQLKLDEEDFAWATDEVCALAGDLCAGRVVSTLEGGYDLPALARSAQAHVQAMLAA